MNPFVGTKSERPLDEMIVVDVVVFVVVVVVGVVLSVLLLSTRGHLGDRNHLGAI